MGGNAERTEEVIFLGGKEGTMKHLSSGIGRSTSRFKAGSWYRETIVGGRRNESIVPEDKGGRGEGDE